MLLSLNKYGKHVNNNIFFINFVKPRVQLLAKLTNRIRQKTHADEKKTFSFRCIWVIDRKSNMSQNLFYVSLYSNTLKRKRKVLILTKAVFTVLFISLFIIFRETFKLNITLSWVFGFQLYSICTLLTTQ